MVLPTQQFIRLQAEPLNGSVDPGPLFLKKLLALASQQQTAGASLNEHAETAPLLDEFLVNQLLITLQNRKRIQPVVGRHVAHGGQRIAFFEQAVEDQGHDAVPKLAVNRLAVIPLTVHPTFHSPCEHLSDVASAARVLSRLLAASTHLVLRVTNELTYIKS
jgi:hypothetical protein